MSIHWPKVVLFGDSQVQRSFCQDFGAWGAMLANKFQRISDVVNRGFSGYTTRSCRVILPRIFTPEMAQDVQAFVIFLGSNDSGGDADIKGHVPLEEYCLNLSEMINYLLECGVSRSKIILVSPGPYDDKKFLDWCAQINRTFPKRSNETVSEYSAACVNLGNKLDIDVINLYEEMMKEEDWPKYLVDGLHLSVEGSHFLYSKLLPLLEKRIDTSNLLMPYWRDINDIFPENASDDLCFQKCPAPIY